MRREFSAGGLLVRRLRGAWMLGVIRPGEHGSTFGGNPLAMAAVKAVLGVVNDPAFREEVRFKGTVLKNALEMLAEHVPGAAQCP